MDNDDYPLKGLGENELHSRSYLMGLRAKAKGTTFTAQHELSLQEYAAHGGAFPIRVRGTGLVGTMTVSGLPQEEDHRLVVTVLEHFLAAS